MCLNGGEGCLQHGDGDVEITSLYMVILAAPVTDRRWIGSVIGLDLVEGGGVGGVASNDRLLQIRKYPPLASELLTSYVSSWMDSLSSSVYWCADWPKRYPGCGSISCLSGEGAA
jgi:hypothetical protein